MTRLAREGVSEVDRAYQQHRFCCAIKKVDLRLSIKEHTGKGSRKRNDLTTVQKSGGVAELRDSGKIYFM